MDEKLRAELPQFSELQQILDDLTYHFMDIREYRSAIIAGLIPKMKIYEDDLKFQMNYPNHPNAAENRYVRIKASDNILTMALKLKAPFSDPVLKQLHIALFDSCATVRLSLSQALEHSGGPASLPYLTQLNELENESMMVKDQLGRSISALTAMYQSP